MKDHSCTGVLGCTDGSKPTWCTNKLVFIFRSVALQFTMWRVGSSSSFVTEGGRTDTHTHKHSFSNQTHIHAHTHTKPSHVSHWFLSWLRTWLTADGTKRKKQFILQKGKHTLGWGRRPSQMADNIVMPIWWTSPRPNRHNRLLCLRMFFFCFFK